MPTLRALLANTVFYVNTALWILIFLPLLIAPRAWALYAMQRWALSCMWLIRWTAGIRWEVRGLENLPRKDGRLMGCIVASKHQSAWETFGLLPYLDSPAYILKKELMLIPGFGWFAAKVRMIPVERAKNAQALRSMTRAAREAVEEGRQLIIFPEGTRQAVDAPPDYKPGAAHLYRQLGVPIVPTALNSGLFWPRRQFARYPGTIVISILPAIAPGLDTKTLRTALQDAVEDETAALVAEGRGRPPVSAPVADPAVDELRS